MAKYGAEVIVHALGFSTHHNDAFLEQLTTMGTSDGTYRCDIDDLTNEPELIINELRLKMQRWDMDDE